jgi:7-cyano-7-deazaguanine synthase
MTSGSAVVLLSGGQDSTTCLFWAKKRFRHVHAVAFDYGQRHRSELETAREISKLAGLEHELVVLELGVLAQLGDSSLVSSSELAGSGGYVDEEMPEGLPTSFVPGRNLLFLGVAAAYAVKKDIKDIVTGVCETDYSGYPDCRESFVSAMQEAVNQAMPSSAGPIHIHTPLMHMDKSQVVHLAQLLGDTCWKALGLSITCYEGRRPGCGECPSCQLRAAGFEGAGLEDPALEAPTPRGAEETL